MSRRASSHLRRVPDPAAPASERAPSPRASDLSSTFSASIVAIAGDAVDVAPRGDGAAGRARVARIAGWVPSVDDVVMVARDGAELVVIAVLEARAPMAIAAPDGTRASLVDGALQVADPEGRILVRWVDGALEVSPPAGDLRLAAPTGHVRIEAGLDVAIASRRDVTISGDRAAALAGGPDGVELASCVRVDARGAHLTGSHVDVTARKAVVTSGEATLVAREASASATRIRTAAERIETTAEHVVIRAKSAVQEVAGLFESKLGRARTLVKGAFSLRSKSTSMKSQEDTSVDGRRVLLG